MASPSTSAGSRQATASPGCGRLAYVMPPYCIDDADLDGVYAAIADAAERFRARGGQAPVGGDVA